jgi:hypothetical protein
MVPEALEKLRAHWVFLVVRYRVLKNNRHHPYHYIRVHYLQSEDYPARREFCTWLVNQEMLERNFVSGILFSDESNFGRQGGYNAHNWHIWAEEFVGWFVGGSHGTYVNRIN